MVKSGQTQNHTEDTVAADVNVELLLPAYVLKL